MTAHKITDREKDIGDETLKGTTNSKPRKLPSWLLASARDGTRGDIKKKTSITKRPKSPEAVPDSKVRYKLLC